MTATRNFERFQYFNFETNFSKEENLTQKLGYRFLVESTKIEDTTFPYRTALSETNVKTNRIGSTKWTYHKERNFAINYFIFLKILLQLKNLL